MIIEIAPYDLRWPGAFDDEARRIGTVLGDPQIRLHHIGSTAVPGLCAKPVIDTEQAIRHLAFRDYLRAHPAVAQAYGELKSRLAREFPYNPDAYMDRKDAFVKVHEAKALRWRARAP